MTTFTKDLSQLPNAQRKWVVRSMKEVLLYPWKLTITRRRRVWRS